MIIIKVDGMQDGSRLRDQAARERALRTERRLLLVTTLFFSVLAAAVLVAWVRGSIG